MEKSKNRTNINELEENYLGKIMNKNHQNCSKFKTIDICASSKIFYLSAP